MCKTCHASLLVGLALFAHAGAGLLPVVAAERDDELADWRLIDEVAKARPDMVRVTMRPYYVPWKGAPVCINPNRVAHTPHDEHSIHVFVTPGGRKKLVTGYGSYPEGTIILKQKFYDAVGQETDFYTGMRKREHGYNPEVGDWEFFALDRDLTTVIARGKIESCADCHTAYASADFVSREYLEPREEREDWPPETSRRFSRAARHTATIPAPDRNTTPRVGLLVVVTIVLTGMTTLGLVKVWLR